MADPTIGGSVVSAISNIAGGLINRDASRRASNTTRDMALHQMQLQKQFAKQGIRWRVEDARKAGIHPLYALGANTTSYTPQSVSFAADTSLGNSLAAAGQDIGRAINSTRTSGERADAFTKSMQAITLENAGLDLEIKKATLASQLARNRDNATPPTPGIPAGAPGLIKEDLSPDARPVGLVQGTRVWTDPNTSNVDDFWQKRYGEPGEYIGAAAVGWADLMHNFRNMSIGEMLYRLDQMSSIPWDNKPLERWRGAPTAAERALMGRR